MSFSARDFFRTCIFTFIAGIYFLCSTHFCPTFPFHILPQNTRESHAFRHFQGDTKQEDWQGKGQVTEQKQSKIYCKQKIKVSARAY